MPIVFAASVEHAGVLLALLIMLAAAKIMAEIFERLRQPGGRRRDSRRNRYRSESFKLGVAVGIYHDSGGNGRDISFVQRRIGNQAAGDFSRRETRFCRCRFGRGDSFYRRIFYCDVVGRFKVEAMFIGAALVATSVGITARVWVRSDFSTRRHRELFWARR
jgi:hypothetical protein